MVEQGVGHIPLLALGVDLRAGHVHAKHDPPPQCHRPVKRRNPSSNGTVRSASARERSQMPQFPQLRALQISRKRPQSVKGRFLLPRGVGISDHIRMVHLGTVLRDLLSN